MADEVLPDPDNPVALKALSDARIAKMRGEDGSNADETKEKEGSARASDGNDATAAAAKAEKPDATPDGGSDPNLSHIPEKYRSFVASLPPEDRDGFLAWTKGGTVRHADVTKFKKDLERASEKVKALESKAAAWDDFASDRRRVEALLAYDKKLKAGAAADVGATTSEEEVPELSGMTSAQIVAFFDKRTVKAATEAAKQARAETLKEIEEKYVSPRTRTEAANAALAQYAVEHGLKHEQIKAATDQALAWSEAHVPGFDKSGITADNVVGFIEPFLPKSVETAAKPTNGAATRAVAGAASLSRGGAAVAPSPVPAWEREQRAPNRGERLGAIATTIERLYGKRVTESQIGDVLARG